MDYKSLIEEQICEAHFPFALRRMALDKILFAVEQISLYQNTKNHLYCPKRELIVADRPKRARAGRPEMSKEITYLISTLHNVWIQAFNKKGRLNRRGHTPSQFVKFASPIMRSVDIYNELDNLNKYRRYVNRISRIIDCRRSVFVTSIKK